MPAPFDEIQNGLVGLFDRTRALVRPGSRSFAGGSVVSLLTKPTASKNGAAWLLAGEGEHGSADQGSHRCVDLIFIFRWIEIALSGVLKRRKST